MSETDFNVADLLKQKWIEIGASDVDLTRFVQRVFESRAAVVSYYVPLVASRADKDPEFVHQLRVASRRADAAAAVFHECLPTRRQEELNQSWKRLRNTCGPRRDLDVLAARLLRDEADYPELVALRQVVRRLQDRAGRPLKKLGTPESIMTLDRLTACVAGRIRWRGRGDAPAFPELARYKLSECTSEFFRKSRKMHRRPDSMPALHATRIAGKRVRYVLELLSAAFDDSLRADVYPIFERVQEQLGDINDAVCVKPMVKPVMKQAERRVKKTLKKLVRHEEKRAERLVHEFRKWWTASRVNELEAAFARYINC